MSGAGRASILPPAGEVPGSRLVDRTPSLLRRGYRFLPELREGYASDLFEIRLMGRSTVCLYGPEAVRAFYESPDLDRGTALPSRIRKTLVGEGGVQTLDGAAHRDRKARFMSLMTPVAVAELAGNVTEELDRAASSWRGSSRVVLLEALRAPLARAVCRWAGVPLEAQDITARAHDLAAMVDGFAAVGPRHWRARRARTLTERWMASVVGDHRSGRRQARAGSAVAVFAGVEGSAPVLDDRVAAVELLNVIRPTVAVSWFAAFAATALYRYGPPERNDAGMEAFAHEVRRFYPFAPFVGARTHREFRWNGVTVPSGRLLLLDLYGIHHDERFWDEPAEFRHDRFEGSPVVEPVFVPQGGGDPATGHRCAGEDITVQTMKAVVWFLLEGIDYRVPEQDLDHDLSRIPSAPRSGFVLEPVR